MLIGVPKEIKPQEYRVGLVPASIREIVRAGGHAVVEQGAGSGIGCSDEDYRAAGAEVVPTAEEVYARADLIVKVKEPQPAECLQLRADQTIFAFLHLAADQKQTRLLQTSGVTAIACETITQPGGGLPLLMPMSEIAGALAVQAGAHCLEINQGGKGKLLGGVPGVPAAHVVVLGGGAAGARSIRSAVGLGARVTVLDSSVARLHALDQCFHSRLHTVFATQAAIEAAIADADLLIGAVLVPGAATPRLVSEEAIRSMRPGSVVVDISIDQGGCFATSCPTTHHSPTFMVDGIVHYCVTNMPGAVPCTSTIALNNASLPFILALINQGVKGALLANPYLLSGLSVHAGHLTYAAVAEAVNGTYIDPRTALG